MGVSGTKEPPRNITFENQLLMTEAALQQLQASVGKSVPQATTATNTRSPGIDSSKPLQPSTTNRPLPTIDTSGTVETWRALSSSVNDNELQRLREEYKQKLLDHERFNREKLSLTKENLAAEVEKVEKKFSKFVYSPICEIERADIEKCYLAYPKQVLTCSPLAEKFMKCVQYHREQSLGVPHPRSIPTNPKEAPEQHTFVDPLTSEPSANSAAGAK